MLVTDTIHLRDTAVRADRELMDIAFPSSCPADIRERISSIALSLRTAAAPLATPTAKEKYPETPVTPPLPPLSALTFEAASARVVFESAVAQLGDRAMVLLGSLIEESVHPRVRQGVISVEAQIGKAIAAGTAALQAGKTARLVLAAMRAVLSLQAQAVIPAVAERPEAAPYRTKLTALASALTLND